MTKKKLFFYSPSDYLYRDIKYLTTVPLFLDSYVKRYHRDLHEKIEWTKIVSKFIDHASLIKMIKNLDIDVLFLSVYVWNEDVIFNLLDEIKLDKEKKFKIVVGGPSVSKFSISKLFDENSVVDFAIYGQGEKAFVSVLMNVINGKKIDPLNDTNLIWKDHEKIRMTPHEFLRLEERSPYLESRDVFEKYVKEVLEDPTYHGSTLSVPYSTSKGCMYRCSFCSWQEGLSHKVYHRKLTPKDELELIGSLGIRSLDITDANFGQHKQDLNIAKTIVDLKNEKKYDFKIASVSFNKLGLEKNIEIIKLWGENNILLDPLIAIQDTHSDILDNIDRPHVKWEIIKTELLNLKKSHPYIIPSLELIQGLPGQTRETWEDTLVETEEFDSKIYLWIHLPLSPAYNEEYVKKMKLGLSKISLNDIKKYTIVTETYSYNQRDWIYFSLLSRIVNLSNLKKIKRRSLIDVIKSNSSIEETLDQLEEILEKGDLWVSNQTLIVSKFLVKLINEEKNFFENVDVMMMLKEVKNYQLH